MKIAPKYFLAVIIVAFTLISPNGVFATTEYELQQQIEEKSKELETINKQIGETQEVLDDLSAQSKSLSKEIRSTDLTVKNLELNIKSSEINIDKLGLEVDDLGYKMEKAEADIATKKDTIASLIRALNEKEKEGFLQILLRGSDLVSSFTDINQIGQMQESLSAEIATLHILREEIGENMRSSTEKKSQLETESKNLKNRKFIVEDQKTYKQTILNQTKNQESAYQKQLSELEKKQRDIDAEIGELEEVLRKNFNASLAPGRGFLSKPFSGTRPLTQEYGYTSFARTAYKTGFHNGMDYGLPVGTPLIAAGDGRVVAVGNNGRVQYGKYIVIKHTDNFYTLYAHLSRQSVSVGQSVSKGELIGYSGNTGYSTGAHLHFGVYQTMELKNFAGAGAVPVGITMNPADYY